MCNLDRYGAEQISRLLSQPILKIPVHTRTSLNEPHKQLYVQAYARAKHPSIITEPERFGSVKRSGCVDLQGRVGLDNVYVSRRLQLLVQPPVLHHHRDLWIVLHGQPYLRGHVSLLFNTVKTVAMSQ